MLIECTAKKYFKKLGIRAEVNDEGSGIIMFIARDHHYKDDTFSSISEGSKLNVRVIGQRFELNDKCFLLSQNLQPKKPKLVFKNDDLKYLNTKIKINKNGRTMDNY